MQINLTARHLDITEAIRNYVQNKFEGHIEQKNFALETAAHRHVLSLDADEALSDELKASSM